MGGSDVMAILEKYLPERVNGGVGASQNQARRQTISASGHGFDVPWIFGASLLGNYDPAAFFIIGAEKALFLIAGRRLRQGEKARAVLGADKR
jgi:hypothetical protein